MKKSTVENFKDGILSLKLFLKDLKNKQRGFKFYSLITLFLLITIFIVYIITNQYWIVTEDYAVVSEKVNGSFTIALISDLHDMDFGFNNNVIVNKIAERSPDMIAVVGDIIDEYHSDITPAVNVMSKLPSIAPTYYVIGNHDTFNDNYSEFKSIIKKSGVDMVIDSQRDISINGNDVRIYGMANYSLGDVEYPEYTEKMNKFCSTDRYKILLCHYPEYTPWFFEQDKYCEYNFDLMLSGHTHGGIVSFPFVGGIYAPNQGFMPEYVKGLYYIDKGNKNPFYMCITGGLGQDRRCVRINNFPEITFITVTDGKEK